MTSTESVEWGVRMQRGNAELVRQATVQAARSAGVTPEELARDRALGNGGIVVNRIRIISTTEWAEA